MDQEIPNRPNRFGVRHIQVLLLFFSFSCSYIIRTNLSTAIEPMTTPMNGESSLNWSSLEKSLVLSSFLWGFSVSQVKGSLLAKQHGAKHVLSWVLILAGIVSFLHPVASQISWGLLLTMRILAGLLNGVVNPCAHFLLARWTPIRERSFLASLAFSGTQFGPAFVIATSGAISSSTIRWPGIFYLSGIMTLAAGLFVYVFGAETPAEHPSITKVERTYIETLNGNSPHNRELPVPWKAIFTSSAFWGFVAAHTSYSWGFNLLLTEINPFMVNVLHFNTKENTLLSVLPYSLMLVVSLVVSPIADWMINRRYMSVAASRKLFNTIGQCILMVCLIVLGFLTPNQTNLAIILITIGVGFSATCSFGVLVNDIDLAPNFAGILASVSNAIGNFLSNFVPLLVGLVVTDETNPYQWRIVFFATGGIYLLCSTLFLVYGKGTIQPWNEGSY